MTDGAYKPFKVIAVEVTRPLPDVAMTDPEKNLSYGGIYCLVRKHGRPIGLVEAKSDDEVLSPSKLEALIAGVRDAHEEEPTMVRLVRRDRPLVSVVVATRDRPSSLARCLDSLLRQNYETFDIIVVDNAPSSSATADMVASRYSSSNGKVRYVREDLPGLGRAHNAGVANATAPVIAFTDDDVIADPGWLPALAANFDPAGKVGCVTGLILPAELETRAQYWTERHGGFGKGFARKVYDLRHNRQPGALFPYAAGLFGSGANMAFSADAIRRIGGFDPALGAGTLAKGGDDLASFVATIKAGFQLVYEPGAIVWHHHRRTEQGTRGQAFGYGVGLGAYLTKLMIDDPLTALHLARALPAGFAHMFGPSSQKIARLPADYPADLVWRERLGILAGIPAYVRSRIAARRKIGPTAGWGAA